MRYLASLLLFSAGCGSVVGADYRGEVLFALQGAVTGTAPADAPQYGVALRWLQLSDEPPLTQAVDLTAQLPSRYTLRVFEQPPEDALVRLGGLFGPRVALAQPIVFEDHNADGIWASDERPVGVADRGRLLWVPNSGLAPQLFEVGFQFVDVVGDVCGGDDVDAWFEPLLDDQADIELGIVEESASDLNCDGIPDDWSAFVDESEACPPEEEFDAECAALAADPDQPIDLDPQDPRRVCLEDTCPELVCSGFDVSEAFCEQNADWLESEAAAESGFACVAYECGQLLGDSNSDL